MSCNNWERGEVLLPAAAVPALRAALNSAVAAERAAMKTAVETMWKELRTLPAGKRRAAAYERVLGRRDRWGRLPENEPDVLCFFEYADWKKPTEVHYTAFALPATTNRTTSWRAGYQGQVALDGRKVTWDVPGGNRAVDHARESAVGRAFFGFLGRVEWTRGTGSAGFVGNDEYNQDVDYAGGGGNYITDRFGPLGTAAAVDRMRMYV
jgi:hypothetical protein